MSKRIIYYTSKNGSCEPCAEINKLIEEGKFSSPDAEEVDLIDITTDAGYQKFYDEILSKQDGAVPSAYMDGKPCQIVVEDGEVHFECPGESPDNENPGESPSNDPPSNLSEKSSPAEEVA